MFFDFDRAKIERQHCWLIANAKTLTMFALVFLTLLLDCRVATYGQESFSDAKVKTLDWLTGSWTGVNEAGYTTEEHWIEPRGGMMLAVNRTSKNGKAQFEFLRIQEKGGSLSLLASPGGRPAVEFKLVRSGNNIVVFENPKHDFPQKITYRRKDDSLHVRIEAVDNGQTRKIEWTWTRNP